jgi:RNA polymerase sigma-70 factor (ECF subfamily)
MGTTAVLATLEPVPARAAGWAQTAILVERAREGDREAFGRLVEQFERTVYAIVLNRLGNPSEAAELTQEVFLHVMRRLGQLREPERFAGWLRQVAARMAINRATRRVPPAPIEDEVLEGVTAHRDDPHDTLVRREHAARLWEALGRLKPLDRDTLVGFYIDGHSLNELAERHDAPLGTIKRRLHTARRRLKEELEGSVVDPDEWTEGERDPDVALEPLEVL